MPFDQVNFVLPAVETDATLRTLIAGRALLSDGRRWAKGDYCVGDTFCVVGALGIRTDRRASRTDAQREAIFYLGAHVPKGHFRIADFNDNPTTTHADVLALFDRAIAARREDIASNPA